MRANELHLSHYSQAEAELSLWRAIRSSAHSAGLTHVDLPCTGSAASASAGVDAAERDLFRLALRYKVWRAVESSRQPPPDGDSSCESLVHAPPIDGRVATSAEGEASSAGSERPVVSATVAADAGSTNDTPSILVSVTRNEFGLGLTFNDRNEIVYIDPRGGAAATAAEGGMELLVGDVLLAVNGLALDGMPMHSAGVRSDAPTATLLVAPRPRSAEVRREIMQGRPSCMLMTA